MSADTPLPQSDELKSSMTVHGVTWLLIRDGKVLLERCPKKREVLGVGEWFVPGGKVEPNDEHVLGALMRELREEWGVGPHGVLPLPILAGSPIPHGPRGLFLMQPYAITVNGELPSESLDGVELRWVPVAEALASPVPQVRMMVAAALVAPVVSQESRDEPEPLQGCGSDCRAAEQGYPAVCEMYPDQHHAGCDRQSKSECCGALALHRSTCNRVATAHLVDRWRNTLRIYANSPSLVLTIREIKELVDAVDSSHIDIAAEPLSSSGGEREDPHV